jgi:signal transduction histidine kinase
VVGLSHELRSPLNAISGYAQLLEQDTSLATKPRDQVRVVRRSADHLSGLIDGILDISKIEAGRLYLSRDEVRLGEFPISLSACSACRPPPRESSSSSNARRCCLPSSMPTKSGCARF